jgi:hypothetical protein
MDYFLVSLPFLVSNVSLCFFMAYNTLNYVFYFILNYSEVVIFITMILTLIIGFIILLNLLKEPYANILVIIYLIILLSPFFCKVFVNNLFLFNFLDNYLMGNFDTFFNSEILTYNYAGNNRILPPSTIEAINGGLLGDLSSYCKMLMEI